MLNDARSRSTFADEVLGKALATEVLLVERDEALTDLHDCLTRTFGQRPRPMASIVDYEARVQQARLEERLRIARELHDTLLQSFHGLLLRFQTIHELLPARPSEAKQNLLSAIDMAAQAITEGRDAVQGLRSPTLESNDLEAAIQVVGEEFAAETNGDHCAAVTVVTEGTPRAVSLIPRDEICRIASEALRNAFRHAQAKHIEVELRYDERQLRLRVRDDGKGIDPKFLGMEGRTGHYGLHGMRERAELMGAKLTVWSALDSGTEIELTIPASRAYATTDSTSRSRFREPK